jgi:hypothetical protein
MSGSPKGGLCSQPVVLATPPGDPTGSSLGPHHPLYVGGAGWALLANGVLASAAAPCATSY